MWFRGSEWGWRIYNDISLDQFMLIVNETIARHKQLLQLEAEANKAFDEVLEKMPEEKFAKT